MWTDGQTDRKTPNRKIPIYPPKTMFAGGINSLHCCCQSNACSFCAFPHIKVTGTTLVIQSLYCSPQRKERIAFGEGVNYSVYHRKEKTGLVSCGSLNYNIFMSFLHLYSFRKSFKASTGETGEGLSYNRYFAIKQFKYQGQGSLRPIFGPRIC